MIPQEPEFSSYTDPQERPRNVGMHTALGLRDLLAGATGGGVLGGVLGHKITPHFDVSSEGRGVGTAAGVLLGGGVGGLMGLLNAAGRSAKYEAGVDQHLRDRERAHEHRMEMADVHHAQRKEMANMRKKASLDGVMLAAMVDELQHIHQEKVALNPAAIGAVGSMLGGLGSKALSGVTSLAAKHAPQMAQGLNAGLLRAGQAVGGGGNLSKLVGGGIAGAGVLGAAGAARGLMGGDRR